MTRRNQPVGGDSTAAPGAGQPCHEFRYDPESSEPLSTTLVQAIADACEVAPEELDRPLQRSIDTDALDSLFFDRYDRSPSGVSLLSFCMCGLEIVIREGQQVSIYELEG